MKYKMDPVMTGHRNRILATFPPYTHVSKEEAIRLLKSYKERWEDGTPTVAYSLVEILNYFEFLALSIRREQLDEEIAYDAFKSFVKNMSRKTQEFIQLTREPDDAGRQSTIYEHFVWLVKRWHNIEID
jgi:hypothetical protein